MSTSRWKCFLPAKYHERANCRESFTAARKLKRFVIMKSNFMPMQLQAGASWARSAHGAMYLRFNACTRPRLQSVLDLHSPVVRDEQNHANTDALLNRLHVNSLSFPHMYVCGATARKRQIFSFTDDIIGGIINANWRFQQTWIDSRLDRWRENLKISRLKVEFPKIFHNTRTLGYSRKILENFGKPDNVSF